MRRMATYAIGDVHGCYQTLQALLERLPFDPSRDRLWLVGDLVNRGPDSLEVLRWAKRTSDELGERFVCVLGNHDVHYLARAAGAAGPRDKDTLDPLLAAPDRDELVDWLRDLPLLHRDGDRVLVHAGLLPSWSPERAEKLAREVEAAIREGDGVLARYAARPRPWSAELPEPERLDQALAVFTLVRTLDPRGVPLADFAGPPEQAPAGATPWFRVPGRRNAGAFIVFGHWAALGLHRSRSGSSGEGVVHALDTGCVWGGWLTALRLEDEEVFQVDCLERPPELPGTAS